MRRGTLLAYSLPLHAGVVLRGQHQRQRNGLVVRLEEDHRTGEGEIAPLPGFSRETLPQAAEAALLLMRRWVAGASILADLSGGEDIAQRIAPSVAFGLSCALAELEDCLPPQAPSIAVPLCSGDSDEFIRRLTALPDSRLAKVKVGLTDGGAESRQVNGMLAALPGLHLRLDANRSWTAAAAAAFAAGLDPSLRGRIDFIEEPCATPAASLAFARDSGIPIAWDETVREGDFSLRPQPGVAAIIIKPTLTGSLRRCERLIHQARQAGLTAVISSSIESSLGLTQLARLSQVLTPGVPPGLDTLSLLGAQLLRRWPGSLLPLQSPALLHTIARAS
ncbi:o-succinylbenzoate synthase [Sodalis ligni]|uniref:o-succinylbenzoate synthase n=1 Tax=Sodalis ligni TaxID=2697027 RepID=A0A4R1NHL2_9GAMM|nr:o-succinylbenzoate synthase [Sodalis ligni]TCL07234.1 O-succinylbenzoate synthase [Sodalis ligni]